MDPICRVIDSRVVIYKALQDDLIAGNQPMIGRCHHDPIRIKNRFHRSTASHTGQDRNTVLTVVGDVVPYDCTRKIAIDHTETDPVAS